MDASQKGRVDFFSELPSFTVNFFSPVPVHLNCLKLQLAHAAHIYSRTSL